MNGKNNLIVSIWYLIISTDMGGLAQVAQGVANHVYGPKLPIKSKVKGEVRPWL